MKKNSLVSNNGLSLSQAQSISNLCDQRAKEITHILNGVNNYSKSVKVHDFLDGKETMTNHVLVTGKELPTDVVKILTDKAKLHACQAFLMENIKAKELMLKEAKNEVADDSHIEIPEKPRTYSPLLKQLPQVGEEFGWAQLSVSEMNEYINAEAFAAHIGQFIHGGGQLDKLRTELGQGIAPVEWMVIQDGVKSPITVKIHETHTSEKLLKIHEDLAALHREHEQKVNYFKAKVKNLVTAENARIAKVNSDAQKEAEKINNAANAEYQAKYSAYLESVKTLHAEFENARQAKIQTIVSMRIDVDKRFQETVDKFLEKVTEK